MKITIIAAIGKNRELGYNNNLIWHLKGDLKFFKKTTMNKTIVMGYNTYKSLPGLLPNRKHIVLTHREIKENEVLTFDNIYNLLEYLKLLEEDVYIIGGSSIYKEFIEFADRMYLTEIDATYDKASVYFPKFDKTKWNKEIIEEKINDNIKFKIVLYERINYER